MKTPERWAIFAFSAICAVSLPSFGQQRVFNWLPANDESVRLDPANYHSGRTYHPGPNGGNMHVDIKAQQPVTIFLANADAWTQALQHPENIAGLSQVCLREHVVETTYVCELPPEAMTLVIRDDRDTPDHAVFAGLGAVLDPNNGVVDPNNKVGRTVGIGLTTVLRARASATRHFVSPNDVHIQYYRWDCVQNCIQPEYQWIEQVKEKYELTSILKVYGGFAPDHDGTQVSIKVKSPCPWSSPCCLRKPPISCMRSLARWSPRWRRAPASNAACNRCSSNARSTRRMGRSRSSPSRSPPRTFLTRKPKFKCRR